jgi:hypothetical protein
MIYMAGGGSVVGCVYLAPKALTPAQALEDTINLAVSDPIYEMLPINYKVFNKGGPSATAFRDYWKNLPEVQWAMNQYGQTSLEKLNSDWLLLNGAMACPTDVNFFSRGICGHVPFIENLVDFEALKTVEPDYTLTAYCIEDRYVKEFGKGKVGVHEFRAALSFPFIYPPYRIDDKHYYEGAAVESLSLISVMEEFRGKVDQIIVFDVLTKDLIHRPRNLMDAYAQSIIVPLVANAEKELAIFEYWARTGCAIVPLTAPKPGPGLEKVMNKMGLEETCDDPPGIEVLPVKFAIPDNDKPYLLDWSRSNLERSFGLGYAAGQKFLADNAGKL